MVLLMRLVTGSKLYGLNHSTSDTDITEIYDHCKPSQTVTATVDIKRWPLSMLMRVADKGGHNGCELMMVDHAWCDVDLLAAFRASYICNPYLCQVRFAKAAETYAGQDTAKGRLRAAMLADWSRQIWETGRFNPSWVDSEAYKLIVSRHDDV